MKLTFFRPAILPAIALVLARSAKPMTVRATTATRLATCLVTARLPPPLVDVPLAPVATVLATRAVRLVSQYSLRIRCDRDFSSNTSSLQATLPVTAPASRATLQSLVLF